VEEAAKVDILEVDSPPLFDIIRLFAFFIFISALYMTSLPFPHEIRIDERGQSEAAASTLVILLFSPRL